MTTKPVHPYPKGDLRRMLAVLGSVADLGQDATLLKIVAQTGLDKKTVSVLLQKAGWEAGVEVVKSGSVYSIGAWGPVIRPEGALLALRGATKSLEPKT